MSSPICNPRRQRGGSLLEALISIVIFAIGTLALLAMYGRAVTTVSDTQQRTDASAFAGNLLQDVWIKIERDNAGQVLPDSLTKFAYAAGGNACGQFGGGEVEPTVIAPWLAALRMGAKSLPGAADAGMAQVRIEPAANNRITVVVCWRNPIDGMHRHETVAYIN